MINTSLPPLDSVYEKQGFGQRSGFGSKPALLLVDFVVSFADPAQFGGGNIGSAIEQAVVLLQQARAMGMPIVHTRVVYADDGSDANGFTRKVPTLLGLTETAPSSQIVPPLRPQPGELVVRKQLPSAFAGTGLSAWLAQKGVDTVIVAGATTSGCVRASVVDAMGAGYRVVVGADCVGDRAEGPHQANLFDMQQKYADVLPLTEILRELQIISEVREIP